MKTIARMACAFVAAAMLVACAHYEAGYDARNPGCANESGGVPWHHPSKSAREFRDEDAKCRSAAAVKAEAAGRPGNIFMIADETRACLQQQYGWIPGCK
jgi:hypothetical protein